MGLEPSFRRRCIFRRPSRSALEAWHCLDAGPFYSVLTWQEKIIKCRRLMAAMQTTGRQVDLDPNKRDWQVLNGSFLEASCFFRRCQKIPTVRDRAANWRWGTEGIHWLQWFYDACGFCHAALPGTFENQRLQSSRRHLREAFQK